MVLNSSNGKVALHYIAGEAPDTEMSAFAIRTIAARNVNVNACERLNGMTPLLLASYYGKVHQVEALLEVGARANIKDRHGDTAKEICCEGKGAEADNKEDIFELLDPTVIINEELKILSV